MLRARHFLRKDIEMKPKRELSRAAAWRIATGASILTVIAGAAAERDARAGCNDGACGRIDWTEVTDMDQGAPAAAKLHGGYAWEASPDTWATHPVVDKFPGYFWLTCRPPGGAADPTCKQALASEMAKAGTNTTILFNGNYFVDGGTVQPRGLFREGTAGEAALYAVDVQFGSGPMNPQTCASALGVPRSNDDAGGSADADPGTDASGGDGSDGSGGSGGSGSGGSSNGGAGSGPWMTGIDSTTASGGAGGSAPAPAAASDDGGCSLAHRGSSGGARVVLLALLAAAFGIGRRSRKRG
jgi:hypothetical protein